MASLTPRIDAIQAGQNLCINGSMDFWQRGTSFSPNNAFKLADRYKYFASGGGGYTVSRSTDVPSQLDSGYVSTYSLLTTVTSANASPASGNYSILSYMMEGLDYVKLHNTKVRFQFYVKSSVAGIYSFSLQNSAGTRVYTSEYTINAANTWEKKVFDIQLDNQGTWLFDKNVGLYVNFVWSAGSSLKTSSLNQWLNGATFASTNQTNLLGTLGNTWQVSQISIIPGDFPSTADIPFSRAGRLYQQEWDMCQRYCTVLGYDNAVDNAVFGLGQCVSTTAVLMTITLPTVMRAAPTIGTNSSPANNFVVGAAGGGSTAVSSYAMNSSACNSCALLSISVASGLVAGNATYLARASGNTTGIIVLDAEL